MVFGREKIKKMIAIETARAAVVTQWTKKVIVEKQTLSNDQDPALVIYFYYIRTFYLAINNKSKHISLMLCQLYVCNCSYKHRRSGTVVCIF